MNESHRMIALFGYETDGGPNSFLWKNPWHFSQPGGQSGKMLDESYSEWKAKKRSFKGDEITTGEWSKVGDHGHSFKVKFLPDGRLIERNVSGDNSWEGTWQLVGSVLRMKVGDYELDVFANKEGNVHSGVEVFQGQIHAYFKMAHDDTDPLGIR